VLVRTWNLFHGNTVPPGRRAYLREMVELVTADRPDVVCLQEVPAWALGRLGRWAGMAELPARARRASLGVVPIPAGFGRLLTAPHYGVIRSAFHGQGIAILAAPPLRVAARATMRANPNARRAEPRVAQRVELELADGRRAVVANVHCTNDVARAEPELASTLAWAEAAAGADLLVVAGDFNTTPEVSPALRGLRGYTMPLPGRIDQVLVRGAPATAHVWPDEDRAYGGRLLSDHAPVEARIELGR
jgi:endonuclease/exonuclease/phosphatase family metal-dependent hydrolase